MPDSSPVTVKCKWLPPSMMDLCTVEIICPCKLPPQILRLGVKTFQQVLQEVKWCSCSYVSAAGKVDRTDKWTDIASDVMCDSSTDTQLGSQAGGVLSS